MINHCTGLSLYFVVGDILGKSPYFLVGGGIYGTSLYFLVQGNIQKGGRGNE